MIFKSELMLFRGFIAICVIWGAGMFVSCSKAKPLREYLIVDGDSTTTSSVNDVWMAPDTSSIPYDESGALIRYGKALVANTGAYFGPKGKVNHNANGMNCQNCHLKAGTKLYANSYCAVYSIYPKFRARSGTVENLERRINDCMERSLNGKKLDSLSHEMRALVAYINWVGKNVKKGVSPKGASVVDVPFLNRPADIEKGKKSFNNICATCHEANGQGKLNPDGITYIYPPLWGPNSYNTAAGMYRISRLAGFIKSNMPDQLSSHDKPILTDEQAWDIAAYISSMPRPEKRFKNDWPDITKKPIDLPFGPYADQFTEEQHKYGPFTEIVAAAKVNEKK
ncbi:MAG: c-type cytochrome [Saprospiraceae bacterium]|uniref:C-type cytochrome n=1 Tax=Candidatus Opimibacter skivensis TaxID=2982028 RepID=A0A9D7SRH1_9BACT|nr:c-type cytochrome [Candidatus Opimibacter skivensis]